MCVAERAADHAGAAATAEPAGTSPFAPDLLYPPHPPPRAQASRSSSAPRPHPSPPPPGLFLRSPLHGLQALRQDRALGCLWSSCGSSRAPAGLRIHPCPRHRRPPAPPTAAHARRVHAAPAPGKTAGQCGARSKAGAAPGLLRSPLSAVSSLGGGPSYAPPAVRRHLGARAEGVPGAARSGALPHLRSSGPAGRQREGWGAGWGAAWRSGLRIGGGGGGGGGGGVELQLLGFTAGCRAWGPSGVLPLREGHWALGSWERARADGPGKARGVVLAPSSAQPGPACECGRVGAQGSRGGSAFSCQVRSSGRNPPAGPRGRSWFRETAQPGRGLSPHPCICHLRPPVAPLLGVSSCPLCYAAGSRRTAGEAGPPRRGRPSCRRTLCHEESPGPCPHPVPSTRRLSSSILVSRRTRVGGRDSWVQVFLPRKTAGEQEERLGPGASPALSATRTPGPWLEPYGGVAPGTGPGRGGAAGRFPQSRGTGGAGQRKAFGAAGKSPPPTRRRAAGRGNLCGASLVQIRLLRRGRGRSRGWRGVGEAVVLGAWR